MWLVFHRSFLEVELKDEGGAWLESTLRIYLRQKLVKATILKDYMNELNSARD